MQVNKYCYYTENSKCVLFSLVTVIFIIQGCKVAAPPKSEELQKQAFQHFILPSTWKAGTQLNIDTSAAAANWLSAFNDADLDSLVAEAIQYNLDLAIGATRIEQSAGYVKVSQAALRPALNILGREGTQLAGGDFTAGLNGALLAASWELDLWGRLRNARNASLANLDAVMADYEFAKLSIAGAVARSWYLASETYLASKFAGQMVETSEKILNVAKHRYEVGIGTNIDVEVAEANLNSMKDGLEQMNLAYSSQLRALEVLAGRYPAAEIQVKNELIQFNDTIPAGIPLQILEKRPDLMAAEKRFAAAFYRVGEANAAKLPSIKLTASLGLLTSNVLELKPSLSNPFGGFGGSLLAPIYHAGEMKANVEIRTAEQKQAVAEYARAALNAIVDVENALDNVTTLMEREKYLSLAVASNQKAFKLEENLFEIGKTDLRNVTKQQLDLFTSQILLLRIQSEKILQRINLYMALGGNM